MFLNHKCHQQCIKCTLRRKAISSPWKWGVHLINTFSKHLRFGLWTSKAKASQRSGFPHMPLFYSQYFTGRFQAVESENARLWKENSPWKCHGQWFLSRVVSRGEYHMKYLSWEIWILLFGCHKSIEMTIRNMKSDLGSLY